MGGGQKIIFWLLYAYHLRKTFYYSVKTGFSVGLHSIDWGLRFMHMGPITINSHVKIGKNFHIYPQVLIGWAGVNNIPKIGNNVTICAGAKIIGGLVIGDNCVIAANSLIIKDVPDNTVMVAPPAYKLKDI